MVHTGDSNHDQDEARLVVSSGSIALAYFVVVILKGIYVKKVRFSFALGEFSYAL